VTAVRVGRVATYRKARIHLAIDGVTCGAARRASIGYEATRPDLAVVANLCKRCFRPARVEAAEMAVQSAHGVAAERARQMLAAVTDSMKSPKQRAADEELIARIARTIELAAPILALPLAERSRTWAGLRADYLRTHPQPQAA
jgi:hypothetical protein